MKFRLIYRGQVPPSTKNKKNTVCKHEIRKNFHHQIKNFLSSDRVPDFVGRMSSTKRKSYQFVPIVRKKNNCSLDILFLRSDIPGSPGFAGDIDNRVKTLLNALKMPSTGEIPPGASPGQDEDPLFCLLEDDSLVTQLSVEMDQLLDLPRISGNTSLEAMLIITVDLEPGLLTKDGTLIL